MQQVQNLPHNFNHHKAEQPQLHSLTLQMECHMSHTKLCLTVTKPRVVSALFRAVLILSVFIQPAICSQPNLPGYIHVVGGTTEQQS